MNLSRRGFIGALAAATAGAVLDPERLLWKPGKAFSLPSIVTPPPLAAPGLLKVGDLFTIDGVFAVNPVTRKPTTRLQQFVVTADIADGATLTAAMHPVMRFAGEYQNVSNAPAPDASWSMSIDVKMDARIVGRRMVG